ncbi:DUF3800 domain-containing protein [Corynebacterium pseudotuberculosis]|uniref:DUF3800 domain-containing protein n=1 Tax=Corynebacterium pseudotuberculosis TaxID=1719 RepID=UPI000B5F7BD2|nr:DUF3800 domain-containing protein [Corynebacterium pseudotuberculosis]WFP66594.1 DUF3800 domain-containing protein [Corynebacterium pseudotuberculosis]
MYNLFVDESYQHSHYYVAGVLVDEKQCRDLEARLDDLAQGIQTRNQWLAPPEFHGHALMNGLDDWKSLNGHFGACVNIYQKVMHAIQNSGARVYLERVNEYCAIAGQMCKVIADTVPQQDQFNEAIQGFVRTSTPGYRGQRLLCVNGDIEFVDSRVSRGVQAADMSAYVLRRYREEKTASKAVRKANARLVKALGPALVHQRKWRP